MERKSFEVGPFAGLVLRGTVLPLGNNTVKVTTDNGLVGLGLPLSAYRTVGWAATLLGAFCGLLICLLSLEIITGDLRWGECLTLPCYGVTLLGGVVRPAGIMNTQHGSTP